MLIERRPSRSSWRRRRMATVQKECRLKYRHFSRCPYFLVDSVFFGESYER